MKGVLRYGITLLVLALALAVAYQLWQFYLHSPWTRDGRVSANIITIAPDVSGLVTEVAVLDNQHVKKGDVLMQIDPAHYQIQLEHAKSVVAAKKALLDMYQQQAQRRHGMADRSVSRESKINADNQAEAARADYQQALAMLDAAKLNLARTTVHAQTDGFITNLAVFAGEYAHTGEAVMALIDEHSFWVYGYFEETKLPLIHEGDNVDIALMNGQTLTGTIDGIARGIYDRDNPQSRDLVADVNPTFHWVRLAQRVPVHIRLDDVPANVFLAAGMTCTVVVKPAA